ncbi:MAG TPA: NAD(P)-dependent oxidoreductase [Myxococcaceae bacterium]|jgi:lactate dehydrogenase-like 2-hydroxyacid dehydrogenase
MDRFQQLGLLGFAAGDLPTDALDQLQARARQVRPLEPGPEVDGLLLQLGARADAALLRQLPRLRCAVVYGTDHSGVDLEAAAAQGVTVCHLPGYSTQAVAEASLRLALQLVAERTPRRELCSLRIGIAGLGRIGGRVAQLLIRGLGAQVRYWSRARKPQAEAELGLRFAPLDELVAWSEALLVHLPLDGSTRGLLDAARIAALPLGALLVHLSPLEILDLRAVERRVRSGDLAFAFDHADASEISFGHAAPPSNETVEAARERWRLCLEVLDAFLAGEPRHRVRRADP